MTALPTAEKIHVAGLPVIDADVDAALDLIWDDARRRTGHAYVLINGYSAKLRRDDPSYARAIEDSRAIPLPDGVPLSIAAKLLRLDPVRRCPGPDLMAAACERAALQRTRFYLLGGGFGTAEHLRDVLLRRHPGLRIVGSTTPPFGEWSAEASEAMVADVRASGADVVWLGVSAPKQEKWALEHLGELGGLPVVCVGAAFDFLSGRKRRAPKQMRRFGFEWLYRLASEPRRLWRRYLIGNIAFVRDLLQYRDHPCELGAAEVFPDNVGLGS